MPLRPVLRAIVEKLLASGRRELTIDELGDAIGVAAVSSVDVGELMETLEARGVRITAPSEGAAREDLVQVVGAARALQAELGRQPTIDEVAARSGLPPGAVRAALLFARVLGR